MIGCRCVAAPVRDAADRVIAVISVSVPTPRFNQEVAQHIRTAVKGNRQTPREPDERAGAEPERAW